MVQSWLLANTCISSPNHIPRAFRQFNLSIQVTVSSHILFLRLSLYELDVSDLAHICGLPPRFDTADLSVHLETSHPSLYGPATFHQPESALLASAELQGLSSSVDLLISIINGKLRPPLSALRAVMPAFFAFDDCSRVTSKAHGLFQVFLNFFCISYIHVLSSEIPVCLHLPPLHRVSLVSVIQLLNSSTITP